MSHLVQQDNSGQSILGATRIIFFLTMLQKMFLQYTVGIPYTDSKRSEIQKKIIKKASCSQIVSSRLIHLKFIKFSVLFLSTSAEHQIPLYMFQNAGYEPKTVAASHLQTRRSKHSAEAQAYTNYTYSSTKYAVKSYPNEDLFLAVISLV